MSHSFPYGFLSEIMVFLLVIAGDYYFLLFSGYPTFITSGAMYAEVPQHSKAFDSESSNSLETPKSQILTYPVLLNKMFSSLISLCKTFLLCM